MWALIRCKILTGSCLNVFRWELRRRAKVKASHCSAVIYGYYLIAWIVRQSWFLWRRSPGFECTDLSTYYRPALWRCPWQVELLRSDQNLACIADKDLFESDRSPEHRPDCSGYAKTCNRSERWVYLLLRDYSSYRSHMLDWAHYGWLIWAGLVSHAGRLYWQDSSLAFDLG